MCDRLADLRQALTLISVGFDAAALSVGDAATVVGQATAIEAAAAALKALAAARAAQDGEWASEGFRSSAEALAHRTGVSVGSARQTLETGRQLQAHPELARAAGSGHLSPAQTALIAEASDQVPEATARLIHHAQRSSLADLRNEVARTNASVGIDEEARRRARHARRRLRAWTDPEGSWHLHAVGNPEDGAQIVAAITPIAHEIFHEARRAGRRESPDAYAFDALVELAARHMTDRPADPDAEPAHGFRDDADRAMATPPSSGSSGDIGAASASGLRALRRVRAPVKILVRIDYDTFLRGVALPGETCEIVGYGPVAVSAVNDLITRGDPFIAAILTRGEALVGVAHLGRRPTANQQSALQWLYPSCAAEGCPVQGRLEYDHRLEWAKTHYTMLDQLDALCAHHHALKTRCNWALTDGVGKRPFVAPSDPRHPTRSPGTDPGRSVEFGSGRPHTPGAVRPPIRPSRTLQRRRRTDAQSRQPRSATVGDAPGDRRHGRQDGAGDG